MTEYTSSGSVTKLARAARYGVIALALLFAAGAAVQVFIAGLGVFDSAQFWDDHVFLGRILGPLALLLPVLALLGRLGRGVILHSTLITVLYVVQMVLANIDVGPLAALHAVNAFVLVGSAFGLGMRTLGIVRAPASGYAAAAGEG